MSKGARQEIKGIKTKICVNISRTYGERAVDMASQFSCYNFLVIDLFIVVARQKGGKIQSEGPCWFKGRQT